MRAFFVHCQLTPKNTTKRLTTIQLNDYSGAIPTAPDHRPGGSGPEPTVPTSAFTIPPLQAGERYAGIALDATGKPILHVVLLPDQPAERLSWDKAMAWAESIGANLPARQETALLFANAIDAFAPARHWTCEQYAGDASGAWGQYFDSGPQGSNDKGYKGRVRAVRRVLID